MFWSLKIPQSARKGGIAGYQNITSSARKAGDFLFSDAAGATQGGHSGLVSVSGGDYPVNPYCRITVASFISRTRSITRHIVRVAPTRVPRTCRWESDPRVSPKSTTVDVPKFFKTRNMVLGWCIRPSRFREQHGGIRALFVSGTNPEFHPAT